MTIIRTLRAVIPAFLGAVAIAGFEGGVLLLGVFAGVLCLASLVLQRRVPR